VTGNSKRWTCRRTQNK